MPRRTTPRRAETLTPEQAAARARWQRLWNLPILLAAFVPLFVTSPDSRGVEIAVGAGSWLVFVIDLGVVILTFPYYLFPAFRAAPRSCFSPGSDASSAY